MSWNVFVLNLHMCLSTADTIQDSLRKKQDDCTVYNVFIYLGRLDLRAQLVSV